MALNPRRRNEIYCSKLSLILCEDVNMAINLRKIAVLIVTRGKITYSAGIALGKLDTLESIGNTAYKYFCILQDFVIHSTEVKHYVLAEYYHRCKNILSSNLNGNNKYIKINSYALLVVSYTGCNVKWTVAAVDHRIHKLFTIVTV